MADNEVYIDTRLRGVDDVIRDIKKVEKQLDSLDYRMRKAQSMDVKHDSKSYRNMEYDAEMLNERLAMLNEELAEIGSNPAAENQEKKTKKYKEACDRTSGSIRKMGNEQKRLGASFGSGLKTLLKYSLGIRSLFVLVNKLRRALVDGFKNLAQFNDGVNPTNEALSRLKSAFTQLKNTFATAFAPLLTVVEPILTSLVNKLIDVVNTIGMVVAKLTGATTFIKATKVQENYAKSLNNTAKSAKKAQQYLSGLDEIKTFTSKDKSDDGSVSPNKMFETVGLDSKLPDWFSGIDFTPLIQSFEKLKASVEPIVDGIGKGIKWMFDNALKPLAKFTIESALPSFFNLLSNAVEHCNKVFAYLKPYAEQLWKDVFVPMGQFLGDTLLYVFDEISGAIDRLGNLFKSRSDTVNKIMDALMKTIQLIALTIKAKIQFLVGTIRPFFDMVINIVSHTMDALSGLIDFIAGAFTNDWEKAWNGVKDVLKGIFNIIVDIIEGAINMVIGGINKLSFDIPDWVPDEFGGGKHFGLNISEVKLPRLATGTVVPRQSKEFMAILGDNNKESEIVSPLSTMKQAMLEAMAEYGGGGGSYQFTAQINRRTLFNEFIEEAKIRQLQSGKNPLLLI